MLDPKAPIALLPQDREIMAILDMSEAEYRAFCLECRRRTKFVPGEPVAFEPVTFAITLLVGIALSAISALLAPKQQEPEEAKLEESTVDGQDIVRKDRFAPKSGFDSVQNVVTLGSVIPIVYAKRETISGKQYGGIRINTNMLWSQLQSIGGGQFFRGIFMVGEATNVTGVPDGPVIDFAQTALGNNTLGSYYLKTGQDAGRATIYYSPGNGRIQGGDPGAYYKLGVVPDEDPGNKENNSPAGPDVFSIESASETPDKSFCQAVIPSNQSTFGLSGFIGNRFGFKLGEKFEPVTQWQARKDGEYERQDSNQKVAQNRKDRAMYSTKAGFIAEGGESDGSIRTIAIGETIKYKIFQESDFQLIFEADGSSSGGEEKSEVKNEDVASTVSSLQRGYDERINVGDLYRAGSATLICTKRSATPFASDADIMSVGSGNTVEHEFEAIDGGQIHVWDETTLKLGPWFSNSDYTDPSLKALNATESSHAVGCAIASFALERSARTIEIGFRSRLGIKSSGIANFNSLNIPPEYQGTYDQYQEYVDAEFCGGQEDGDDPEDESYRKEIQAGKYTSSDDRYSFFRIRYKAADDSDFKSLSDVFCIRSQTSQEVYNYLRIRFTDSKRREFRIIPFSGWEIRNSITAAGGTLLLLDPHIENKVVRNTSDEGIQLVFNGIEGLGRSPAVLGINAFANLNTGNTAGLTTANVSVSAAGSGYGANLTNKGGISLVPGTTTGDRAQCRINTNASGAITSLDITRAGDGYSIGDTLTLSLGDLGFNSDNPFTGTPAVVEVIDVADSGRQQIGFAPEDDNGYYVDAYARIAEAFTYSEVTNSASQPENSISYVNIIDENTESPDYNDMAIVGLNIRSTKEISRLDQLSVYVTRGVIDSHLFPEVFLDLLTNTIYGTGGFFKQEQIDTASFTSAATFTQSKQYFFDGAITNKVNLRTWGSDMAANFLLDLAISGGKFKLSPVANFDGTETPVALFTSGNILEDSFEMSFFDIQDRIPPVVSVKWREERVGLTVNDAGLFPRTREVRVSWAAGAGDVPEQSIDMSDFCTNEQHAIDRAKWMIVQKLYIQNAVKFSTVPTEAGIQVGSIIKLGMETREYDQPKNGSIGPDGTVTSYPPLADGTYPVLLWDGDTYSETTITVSGGKDTSKTNSVFCLRDSSNKAETYKVQKIAFNEEGNLDVEAVFWPTTDAGVSRLVEAFNDDSKFLISK